MLNIVLNNFTNDSRVSKTAKFQCSLVDDVVVLALHSDGLLEFDDGNKFIVKRIKLFTRNWPKWRLIQILKYIELVAKAVWLGRGKKSVHCNDLSALPIGLLIKLTGRNVKVVYDCHEYETEVNGLSQIERVIARWVEKILIPYADAVLTVSDSIANEYARLYSMQKPHLVLNCPPFVNQVKQNIFRERFGIRGDQMIFLYQGGLSKGRGIEVLLDAFTKRKDDRCVFVCMGYGPLESMVKCFANSNKSIFFHPAVSQNVLLNHTSSADFGILFYEDSCLNHRYCSPNKIFEYLMAGIPVLTSNLFEMRRLVESESVGLVAETNTAEGFLHAVEKALTSNVDEMLNNVKRVRQRYCWEEQEKVLKDVYAKL